MGVCATACYETAETLVIRARPLPMWRSTAISKQLAASMGGVSGLDAISKQFAASMGGVVGRDAISKQFAASVGSLTGLDAINRQFAPDFQTLDAGASFRALLAQNAAAYAVRSSSVVGLIRDSSTDEHLMRVVRGVSSTAEADRRLAAAIRAAALGEPPPAIPDELAEAARVTVSSGRVRRDLEEIRDALDPATDPRASREALVLSRGVQRQHLKLLAARLLQELSRGLSVLPDCDARMETAVWLTLVGTLVTCYLTFLATR